MKRLSMSRKDAYKLIEKVHSYTNKEIDFSNYIKEYQEIEQEEFDIEYEFLGVSNGFLSELIYAITGYKVEVYGEVEELFTCPCCGYKTLTEPFNPKEGTGYDICPYCNWEDDGTTDIQSYCAINKGSMLDYRDKLRLNFNKYYTNKWLKN